jgi:hypothetical protein
LNLRYLVLIVQYLAVDFQVDARLSKPLALRKGILKIVFDAIALLYQDELNFMVNKQL